VLLNNMTQYLKIKLKIMNKLELKAISHIRETLGKVDRFPVYSIVSDKLKDLGIDNEKKRDILKIMDNSIFEKMNKYVMDSKDWLDILINYNEK